MHQQAEDLNPACHLPSSFLSACLQHRNFSDFNRLLTEDFVKKYEHIPVWQVNE